MNQVAEIEVPNVEGQRKSADSLLTSEPNSRTTGFVPPPVQHPRLGCAGIVRRGADILLGKRDKEPNRGLWVLPGGGVDFGESLEQTIRRELAEEAGIEVEVQGVFQVYEIINPPNEHRVIVYVKAEHRRGEPTASSDLSDVRFFSHDRLKEMSSAGLISPVVVDRVLRESGAL